MFAYAFKIFPEANSLHYWAFNLWDRIILTAAFHDPDCTASTVLSSGRECGDRVT